MSIKIRTFPEIESPGAIFMTFWAFYSMDLMLL